MVRVQNGYQSDGHLLWWAVPAVFPNPLGVVDFCAVEDGHMVVAAVVVPLHVKLLKLDLDNLQHETHRKEGKAPVSEPVFLIWQSHLIKGGTWKTHGMTYSALKPSTFPPSMPT